MEPRMMPKRPCPAVNNHFLFDTVDHVPLFPGEIVVVLQIQQDFGPRDWQPRACE